MQNKHKDKPYIRVLREKGEIAKGIDGGESHDQLGVRGQRDECRQDSGNKRMKNKKQNNKTNKPTNKKCEQLKTQPGSYLDAINFSSNRLRLISMNNTAENVRTLALACTTSSHK
jgi:hypothetical protein